MHEAAFHFIAREVEKYRPMINSVIEIGSLNMNGSVRPLFDGAKYVGLDRQDGRDVDVVCDAEDYGPDHPQWIGHKVDCVVCCETLEHAPNWKKLIKKGMEWLDEDGVFLITCAGPARKPHSSRDGSIYEIEDWEHYKNISPSELTHELLPDFVTEGTANFGVQVRTLGQDTQAVALRHVL